MVRPNHNRTARKVDQDQRERLLNYLEKIPPSDAVIFTGGIIAGSQGYTPLSYIMKALHSNQIPEILPQLSKNSLGILGGTPLGISINEGINVSSYVTDLILGKKKSSGSNLSAKANILLDPKIQEYKAKYTELLALGSVGMIESYMITRPGAFAAAMNLLQTGMSSVTGAAGAAGSLIAGL